MKFFYDNRVILQYLKQLISRYENEKDIKKKKVLANDIVEYYNTASYNTILNFKLLSVADELCDTYDNLIKNDKLILEIDELSQNSLDNLNNIYHYEKEELEYIKYMVNNIDLNWNPEIKFSSSNAIDYVNDYLSKTPFAIELEKSILFDNENFRTSTFSLLSDCYILFINEMSAGCILHEFLHGYSFKYKAAKNNDKYEETTSIMAELGINSKYKELIVDRISEISKINNLDFKNLNYYAISMLKYIMAGLISIPYIYKYGNNIDIIENGINIILKNNNKDVFKMLELLNLKEKDIIDSFNNVDKVLLYKRK